MSAQVCIRIKRLQSPASNHNAYSDIERDSGITKHVNLRTNRDAGKRASPMRRWAANGGTRCSAGVQQGWASRKPQWAASWSVLLRASFERRAPASGNVDLLSRPFAPTPSCRLLQRFAVFVYSSLGVSSWCQTAFSVRGALLCRRRRLATRPGLGL